MHCAGQTEHREGGCDFRLSTRRRKVVTHNGCAPGASDVITHVWNQPSSVYNIAISNIMKKLTYLCFSAVLIIGLFLNTVSAQTQDETLSPDLYNQSAESDITSSGEEYVKSFLTNMVVNTDNSIDVTETIIYNTGTSERHGIYRGIYTVSSQDRSMSLNNVFVTDENGQPYQFEVIGSVGGKQIKIGDPDMTFTGEKTYILKYHATRAVAQLKDYDEIYWNVTGNEWDMPILEAKATVSLPGNAVSTQQACYWGEFGSDDKCEYSVNSSGVYTFLTPNQLDPYQGLTIAVGFPKGIVSPYTLVDNIFDFFLKYLFWLISGLIPVLSLFFSLRYWYKYGRDPKGTGVIIPQYDVPDGLTPIEVSGIANEKVNASQISAEIIYLATKGYLKINQLEERFIGLIKTTDYELVKLKDHSDLANSFDQKLLKGLFDKSSLKSEYLKEFKISLAKKSPKLVPLLDSFTNTKEETVDDKDALSSQKYQSVKLSDLKYEFASTAQSIVEKVLDALLNKKYYSNLGRIRTGPVRWALIMFMAVWASGFFGVLVGTLLFNSNPVPLIAGIFLAIIIYGVVSHFFPAKTEKGVATTEYLLGLKDYLQIAEKDRLQFHNAPEKKPEVFEKLLPYAMVLGVSDIWAKEFEGIYTNPPSWYSGTRGSAFSALAFTHSISSFSTYASSTMSATHSSGGGSGGGGSSGGGGGGGGGGSW